MKPLAATVTLALGPRDLLTPATVVDILMRPLPVLRNGDPTSVVGFADAGPQDGAQLALSIVPLVDARELALGHFRLVATAEESTLRDDETRELHRIAISAVEWLPAARA